MISPYLDFIAWNKPSYIATSACTLHTAAWSQAHSQFLWLISEEVPTVSVCQVHDWIICGRTFSGWTLTELWRHTLDSCNSIYTHLCSRIFRVCLASSDSWRLTFSAHSSEWLRLLESYTTVCPIEWSSCRYLHLKNRYSRSRVPLHFCSMEICGKNYNERTFRIHWMHKW